MRRPIWYWLISLNSTTCKKHFATHIQSWIIMHMKNYSTAHGVQRSSLAKIARMRRGVWGRAYIITTQLIRLSMKMCAQFLEYNIMAILNAIFMHGLAVGYYESAFQQPSLSPSLPLHTHHTQPSIHNR